MKGINRKVYIASVFIKIKMMTINQLKNYFLLLRPYSLVDLFLVFFLSQFVALNTITYGIKDFFVSLSFFTFWAFLTFSSEAKHKHPYREPVNTWFPYLFLIIPIIVSMIYRPLDLVFVFLIMISAISYINKNVPGILALLSFISRGVYQSFLFLFGFFLYTGGINLQSILVAAIIFSISAARNLIGDIRDIKFDEHTFAVKRGARASYWVAILSYVLGAGIGFYLFKNVVLLYPFLLQILVIIFFRKAYTLHRCSLTFASFLIVELFFTNNPLVLLFLNLLFTAVLSNFIFYNLVPRPSNKGEAKL